MRAEGETTLAARRRVERRQRNRMLRVRITAAEHAEFLERAARAGLTVGAYVRAVGLGDAGPRARRSPPVNAELLGRAIAGLNKAGSNLNQIARAVNEGAPWPASAEPSVALVLAEVREAVADICGAVGRRDRNGPAPG